MGEIAEGLINGDFDFFTGEWLGDGSGYPRTSFRTRPPVNINQVNRRKSLGVRVYLKKRGVANEKMSEVVRNYFTSELGRGKNKKLNEMCAIIQDDDFYRFKNWFEKTYKSKKE